MSNKSIEGIRRRRIKPMKYLPVFNIGFVSLVFLLAITGCSVHSVHDEIFVSDAINERTGHELRQAEEKEIFKLPEGISLEDGLTQDEAVAIALWNNAQFQVDLVALGFAQANLTEAGMIPNPLFTLLFPWGPKQLESWLKIPVDFIWQRPKRVEAAQLNSELVADSLVQHGLDFVRDVLVTYTDLILAQERAQILTEQADLQSEIADIASDRLRIGDISEMEETVIHLEVARIKETSVRYSRDAALLEERLKTLLGLGLHDPDSQIKLTPMPLYREIAHQSAALLTAAFESSPELHAAEIAIEAAAHRVGWEKSKIIDLTAVLDANAKGTEGFEMGPGIEMHLPIFNQNGGNVSRAQAELVQAARQYLAVKHRIAQQVLEAYATYKAAQKSLKILQGELLPSAKSAIGNAELSYSIGEISYLELLDFRRQLLGALLQEAQAEADMAKADANLKHSLGYILID